MSEIARRLGLSREGVRKWVLGTPVAPADSTPLVGSLRWQLPLWRWTDVVHWYQVARSPLQAESGSRRGPRASHREERAFAKAVADVAALNAALDLLRYTGPDGARQLFQAGSEMG